jgi:thymidylate synthase ThyX
LPVPAKRQIYLLDPQTLDPETIAVAFAKTSRSPQSFRKIASELTAERSAEFHEKWVVGYGHASVAEHAILHVAIENVSRLAVETIEGSRLASYTEKSTRYQKWAPDEFTIPPEIERDAPEKLRKLYQTTCQSLFEAYLQSLPPVRKDIEHDFPRLPDESDGAWERRIRSEYVDVCRFFLPAASLANLGMTINARQLEHALRKMLSHPLEEVRTAGEEIKAVALESIPTLLKYVDRVPYMVQMPDVLGQRAATLQTATLQTATLTEASAGLPEATSQQDWCRLVSCTVDAEKHVLAASLYRFGNFSYEQALQYIAGLGPDGMQALAGDIFGKLGRHDIPLRETEHASYLFDVVVDQGGYFELKRHRMMTQTPQPLTTRLGYAVPRRIVSAGLEGLFRGAMEMAAQAYETLAEYNPHVASYVVPNGYNRRVLLDTNLRSARHFVGLRSAENAHFSMRRLALRMAEQIQQATPLLGSFLQFPEDVTWQEIETSAFAQV